MVTGYPEECAENKPKQNRMGPRELNMSRDLEAKGVPKEPVECASPG